MWMILAEAETAVELFALINPIHHTRSAEEGDRCKVEPYVATADVHSASPHTGPGGWTWHTGASGRLRRAGIEGVGLHGKRDCLIVGPEIPAAWPGFEATVKVGATRYAIAVENPSRRRHAGFHAVLDGAPMHVSEEPLRVPLDGKTHSLFIGTNHRGG